MNKQLHVISDGKLRIEEFVDIAIVIEPYVDKFHIREKQKSAKEIYDSVNLLMDNGIPLSKIIINDRTDVASALHTGIQLAYHSLSIDIVKQTFTEMHAGCSIHSLEEAIIAQNGGADYLLYGHVFDSSSKKGLHPRGLKELAMIKQAVNIPVLAIGGITPENTQEVLQTNADGIAVMSGIIQSKDPLTAVKQYVKAIENGRGS
jgi:thiazole tautomerase (transcriptional regulator TenI)